jgi:glycosyltransferase involved in cell wall biosynthesis
MSGQAAAYAQDYAWDKIAAQIMEVYEGLLS